MLINSLSKVRRFLCTDLGVAFLIVLVWKIILTTLGYLIDTKLPVETSGLFTDMPEGILGHTLRWDSGWYLEIIRSNFYQTTSSAGGVFAFYPLYPLLVASISWLSLGFLSLQAASFILSSICTVISLSMLLKIIHTLTNNRRISLYTTILFIASPAAMFMHVFYSEALFISLGLSAYWFALQRRWGGMAILLGILSASRFPAILFIALCAFEFMRAHQWKVGAWLRNPSILWFLITPLGFIVYALWAYHLTGDFLAMFHAYKAIDGWPYQVFNPNIVHTLGVACRELLILISEHGITKGVLVTHILPLGALAILITTSLYGLVKIKGAAIPLSLFGILSFILFTLNSNVTSIHRYTLACISIFIVIALFTAKRPIFTRYLHPLTAGCFVIQVVLLLLFTTGFFAG